MEMSYQLWSSEKSSVSDQWETANQMSASIQLTEFHRQSLNHAPTDKPQKASIPSPRAK